ncbi:MAG: Crp/Fnr family transcriptional regulator [Bacteroidota bacterium]
MEKQLIDHLNQKGRYSQNDFKLLETELKKLSLKKGEIILDEKEVCSSIYFLIQGTALQLYTDDTHNEMIIDLNGPGDWLLNHKSFATRKPSEYIIKVFNDSEVYELSIESIHGLIAKSQSFFQLGKILEESTGRVEFFDHNYTPDQKYQFLMEKRPNLLQLFPQKIIASYLKITPETLSRVRNRFSKR